MTRLTTALLASLALAIICITTGYSAPSKPIRPSPRSSQQLDRTTFLTTAAATFLTFLPATPAFAKDDPSKKGTKADPEFQACLSQCMYECTKPKGSEQRSRAECLPDCKKKCATTKAQMMIGTPATGN
eukprot:CAMPEP_0171328014 /NCGR_PEP_ID=MMETSP0878-20121228/390_1 /TAXON_ID=67004 /ORGANISM="Thalassiosira weissflogii, Strain CCMP1336" /LENGTH=128 /DNA_ID=CAMNT_0011827833 /DNA_START=52 /DNA_END=438 /DNA_ORIENTATION=-